MIKIIQGDVWWEDIARTDGISLDNNWEFPWAIVPKLGAGAVASGVAALSEDASCAELRIAPTDTVSIPVGDYILIVQAENTSLAYRKEIKQERVKVTAQGIV